jgi:hypothetical protein
MTLDKSNCAHSNLRYLSQPDTARRQEPTKALAAKVTRLTEKLTKMKEEMGKLAFYGRQMLTSSDRQISLTDPDSRSMAASGRGTGVVGYNVQVAASPNRPPSPCRTRSSSTKGASQAPKAPSYWGRLMLS